jgi:hypothetical protein
MTALGPHLPLIEHPPNPLSTLQWLSRPGGRTFLDLLAGLAVSPGWSQPAPARHPLLPQRIRPGVPEGHRRPIGHRRRRHRRIHRRAPRAQATHSRTRPKRPPPPDPHNNARGPAAPPPDRPTARRRRAWPTRRPDLGATNRASPTGTDRAQRTASLRVTANGDRDIAERPRGRTNCQQVATQTEPRPQFASE